MVSLKQFVLPVMIFSFGCSSAVEVQTVVPEPSEAPISERREKLPHHKDDITEETVAQILKNDSKALGIGDLKETRDSSEFEMRLWSDQETLLHCLLVSSKNGKWQASMVTGKMTPNRRTGYLYLKKSRSINNLTPMSGWKEISDRLTTKGIIFPFSYKIDQINMPPEPDEGLVKLEFRSDKQYGSVFYQKLSDSVDAKRTIELCKWLQGEFDIDLGC